MKTSFSEIRNTNVQKTEKNKQSKNEFHLKAQVDFESNIKSLDMFKFFMHVNYKNKWEKIQNMFTKEQMFVYILYEG